MKINTNHLFWLSFRRSLSSTLYCLRTVPVKSREMYSQYAATSLAAQRYTSWCSNRCYRERKVCKNQSFNQFQECTRLELWCFWSAACGFESLCWHLFPYSMTLKNYCFALRIGRTSCWSRVLCNAHEITQLQSLKKGFVPMFWQWLLDAPKHLVHPYKVLDNVSYKNLSGNRWW